MKRSNRIWIITASIAAGLCVGVLPLHAQPTTTAAERRLQIEQEATASYENIVQKYMAGEWAELATALRDNRKHLLSQTPDQKKNIRYIETSAQDIRPTWWKATTHPSAVKFKASLWDKVFEANYDPSADLGHQRWRAVGFYKGDQFIVRDLTITVTWKPSLVDNPNPADGKLAKAQNLTLGDLGEVIVWHELGHNYISVMLPKQTVIDLYQNHNLLTSHLQEYFADISAITHTAPKARRACFMFRLQELDYYDDIEPHRRGAHAIGAQFLSLVMQNPEKWPSVRFPPEVPKQQVELNTLIYVYENWKPQWTFEEDMALREFYLNFLKKTGDRVFRSKGMVPLENGKTFSLMVAQDRQHQADRDKWIAEKLTEMIASGRADKMTPEYKEPEERKKRDMIVMLRDGKEVDEKMRIKIPW